MCIHPPGPLAAAPLRNSVQMDCKYQIRLIIECCPGIIFCFGRLLLLETEAACKQHVLYNARTLDMIVMQSVL